eukprot:223468-Chlamydomonas_euryale.AAC.3
MFAGHTSSFGSVAAQAQPTLVHQRGSTVGTFKASNGAACRGYGCGAGGGACVPQPVPLGVVRAQGDRAGRARQRAATGDAGALGAVAAQPERLRHRLLPRPGADADRAQRLPAAAAGRGRVRHVPGQQATAADVPMLAPHVPAVREEHVPVARHAAARAVPVLRVGLQSSCPGRAAGARAVHLRRAPQFPALKTVVWGSLGEICAAICHTCVAKHLAAGRCCCRVGHSRALVWAGQPVGGCAAAGRKGEGDK